MKYLENNICDFDPKFDFNKQKKQNIVSCSFFKMAKHYKDFTIYIRGFIKLVDHVRKNLQDFKIRLFIDNTIYNDQKIMKKINNNLDIVQIVVYNCPKYIKNGFHEGTFGSIVRMFPLFNFKNNDAQEVIISDIELRIKHIKVLTDYYKFSKLIAPKKISYLVTLTKKNSLLKTNKLFYLMAGIILSQFKFDYQIVNKFFREVDNIDIKKLNLYSEHQDPTTRFKYGIDEIFLNHYIKPELMKYKEHIYKEKVFNLGSHLYYVKQKLLKPQNKKYLLEMLGSFGNKKMQNKDLYESIDNLFIGTLEDNPKLKEVTLNIYKLIEKHQKEKNYDIFDKDKLEKLMTFKGIISQKIFTNFVTKEEFLFRRFEIKDNKIIITDKFRDCKRDIYEKCIKKLDNISKQL